MSHRFSRPDQDEGARSLEATMTPGSRCACFAVGIDIEYSGCMGINIPAPHPHLPRPMSYIINLHNLVQY